MANGKLRYTAKWHTTSPQQLVREQKAREAAQAAPVPTVIRRRDGQTQKIPTVPAGGGSEAETKRTE